MFSNYLYLHKKVTITCEEGARISGHIEKNCLSDIQDGIEHILDVLNNGAELLNELECTECAEESSTTSSMILSM